MQHPLVNSYYDRGLGLAGCSLRCVFTPFQFQSRLADHKEVNRVICSKREKKKGRKKKKKKKGGN
jgi:hypothetical protein